jgi:phospholipid-translocating ATPase
MLTGDKIETAKCIAISAGLKNRRQEVFEIKDAKKTTEVTEALRELEGKILSKMLIIDGQSLAIVFEDQKLEENFFGIAKDAPSVCICRCSPT